MPKSSVNASLSSYDDIFSTEESRQEEQREQVRQIPIGELFPFKNHPFKVLDDDSMSDTVESVKQYGVLSPLIARPRPKGGYEIISGHRRQHAAELAGLETLPVIVRQMDDDAAIILMVDSNLQREHEEQEEGVSGHKVRAAARDKLQIIKDYARRGKFDILLVFMFDRIGRIADETPFVVEWFVRNGIRVWSTQEGEQRFDNHTDKLLNYIRFWQADGESEKTSVRTRTSLRQLVEEGHFKGGNAPYGYDLVRSGRINKRKHELYELHINEQEAAVVRIVFDKYVYEGYGPQHIATYLNNSGYRARSGKCWHPSSIRGMVQNLTYTGVLRCGDLTPYIEGE